ncbi:AraC family transcriptional regulator [Paenibacillus lycopersici]|uniref:AraC family transcriptional regulator n=1 Tax=Paenibacillus lycopersici TaxID=2704462 RepID=A0A6C0FWS3_9BACL|nr:AraC family transcriptional regulator [Paenibacillus lycopersici]QHT61177.1 AraC family transcriptional regulator [Paenibacillus lycopersici]
MNHTDIRLEHGFTVEEKIASLTEHELHTHDALEINIPLENSIRCTLLGGNYDAVPGDVFLFRPFEPHWNLIREGNKPARWIMLLFSPAVAAKLPGGSKLLVPFYRMDVPPLIPADSPQAREIGRLAKMLVQEAKTRQPAWELQQFTTLLQILVQLHRFYEEQESLQRGNVMDAVDIIRSVDYMIACGTDAVDMEEAIRISGCGKTRFYEKFKELTGVTPHDFLIRLRLQHASHRLRMTEDPIVRIALDCGFGSSSYFNNRFKEFYGITPRQFRKH